MLAAMAGFLVIALAIPSLLFLIGDILFCRTIGIPRSPWRLLAAGLTLSTLALGTNGSALLEIGGVVAVIATSLVAEQATRLKKHREGPPDSTRLTLE